MATAARRHRRSSLPARPCPHVPRRVRRPLVDEAQAHWNGPMGSGRVRVARRRGESLWGGGREEVGWEFVLRRLLRSTSAVWKSRYKIVESQNCEC